MSKMPIGYKRGYVNFLGCKIDLRLRPMIPRKETAFWVKRAIRDILKKGEKFTFLDVFSGSGCIGLSMLKNCSKWAKMGIFGDIEMAFVKQAKINLKLNKISPKKYRVIRSDIFKKIRGKYDYIFANPPYVGLDNRHLVQESVLDWEPLIAIFGGEDGLLYIRKFLKDAKKYLNKGGKIYLEFDHLRKTEIEKLLPQLGWKNFQFHKDQFGKWRWVEICKK
jgi:release factor glutamine methyltransferase